MLTRLRVRNFKTLAEIDIPLGRAVVFIGPNNSGKTSALQALALWQSGVREWLARRSDKAPTQRSGVALNRLALTHTPIAETRLLWHDLRILAGRDGGAGPDRVLIEILVEGQDDASAWSCGLEFYYANPESIYCRTVLRDGSSTERMAVPEPAATQKIAFLPPMSGLVTEETEIPAGRVDVLIGEGQTAQVLRNLCLRVHEADPMAWSEIAARMRAMFGVRLHAPKREPARGSIRLTYAERDHELDIASAGRGLQQTLLLLAHLYANPGAALLLDEPDAHLEILRQRQIYNVLVECAEASRAQILAASHSEIVLNEAAQRDLVIAFLGRHPHPIVDRGSQLLKALREIDFADYFQAELQGLVLYLEGATDLAVLTAFARRLGHPAQAVLERPFVRYVANQPMEALKHFQGLREARRDLAGFALFDRLERAVPDGFGLPHHCWKRREIENYVISRDVLLRFAAGRASDDLVAQVEQSRRRAAMEEAIDQVEAALRTLRRDPWSSEEKVSDQVLPPIFDHFYERIGLHNEMAKADYHTLVPLLDPGEIDPEVVAVLDRIAAVAHEARPADPPVPAP